MRRARAALTLFALLPWAGCGGCGGCGAGHVAELDEAGGDVTRDDLDAPSRWRAASVGDRFALGEALRTGAAATALVSLRGGSRARLEPDTIVRFLAEAPGADGARVALEAGEAELEVASGDGILADLDVGLARIEGGSRVRIARDADGAVQLRVAVGLARVERRGRAPVEVGAAEAVRVDAAGVTPVAATTPAAAPAPPPAANDEAPGRGVPAGGVTAHTERGAARFRAAGDDGWSVLPDDVDVPLGPGTRVQVAADGRAVVRRGDETVRLGGGAEARVGGDAGPIVELDRGAATATSGATDVAVQVPGGRIVLRGGDAGSEADVDVGRRRTDARVTRGTVELRPDGGDAATLAAGQSGTLAASGRVDAPRPPPRRAHVRVPAGESGTFHDPAGPPVVALVLSAACPEGGVVEAGDDVTPGTDRVNLRLGRRPLSYVVRCLDGGAVGDAVAARGTLRWSRRTGAARLPRRPPRNVLDADGLRYTVLYQTLPPELVLRWREAPAGGPFTLVVEGRDTKRVRARTARHGFPSGALREGSYTFRFEGPGGARSPTSSLRIGFDNAAASVYVREPPARRPVRGDAVRVAGAVVPGASVSVGGRPLPLDPQRRFDAEVPVPMEVDAVAIRIAHPRKGLHHYLRRIARDAPPP